MRKLGAFIQVSLDGYFADVNGDVGWAHKNRDDAEWNAFVADNAKGGGTLVFGRTTYDLMASYWPTPLAVDNDPVVAEQMNNLPKIVFSRTMETPWWKNTTLVKGDLAAEMRKMKNEPGTDMAILGSGSIVSQMAAAGLIDEYQVVVNPVVLGAGKTLFRDIRERLTLDMTETRSFENGSVFLRYALKT